MTSAEMDLLGLHFVTSKDCLTSNLAQVAYLKRQHFKRKEKSVIIFARMELNTIGHD